MGLKLFEVTLTGFLAGQFVQNVQHFQIDDTATHDEYALALDLAKSLTEGDAYTEKIISALPEDYIASSIRCRQIKPTGGPTAVLVSSAWTSTVTEGGRTGEISSAQVSPLIIWIGLTDSAKTGRMFLPGVSEADIDAMVLVSGLVTAINEIVTFVQTIQELVNLTLDYRGAIYHRDDGDWSVINAGYVSPLIGTQRRRLRPV